MLLRQPPQRGMSLIEVMVVIGIIGVLMALAAPSVRSWTQNTKIRGTTDAILNGIQLTRAEAVRRNAVIRFQPTSTVDSACILGSAGSTASYANWVVSYDDPTVTTPNCASALIGDADPDTAAAPRIIQVKSSVEGSKGVIVVAGTAPGVGRPFISFNGLGRVPTGVLAGNLIVCAGIDETAASTPVAIVDVSGVTKCATSTTERRMQVTVTPGGQIRMCDPAYPSAGTDPQRCY